MDWARWRSATSANRLQISWRWPAVRKRAAGVHLFKILGGLASAPWNILAVNALAVALGGQIAPRLAQRVSEGFLRRFLGTVLVLVAALAVLRVLGGQ